MISGSSGDWIGSVGTAQAATTAPTVAGQVPTPVAAGSFAEVMRQSTQTESEPEETKKPSVKAGAVNVVSSDTVGAPAMSWVSLLRLGWMLRPKPPARLLHRRRQRRCHAQMLTLKT